jgi:hypothetical protein
MSLIDEAGLWTIVGTVIGFLLFALWDKVTKHQTQVKERKRIVSLLKTELLDNLDICRNSKSLLARELQMIEQTGTESLFTPVSFSDTAWNICRSADILVIFTDDKLKKLSELYSGLRMVNTMLVNREMTRATSRALAQYPAIIKAYNIRLVESISTTEVAISNIIKTL